MAEVGLSGLMLDYPHSGSAVYCKNLVKHLPMVAPDLDFRLFVRSPSECAQSHMPVERLSTALTRRAKGQGVGARADKLLWETVSLPRASARFNEGILHSLYFAAPTFSPCPVVVTVHDLIPLVLPGYHRSRQSALYSRLMAWAVQRSAAIVTVSFHSQRDIMRLFRLPESRIWVTYEAVDERFTATPADGEASEICRKYGLPDRFVLYLGGGERRKNVDTLVRAWALIVRDMRINEVKLVIVADLPRPDALYPDIPGLIHTLELETDVVLVRSVTEADKPALYRAALLFAFPSRYEGFGFTPLEAMACGTPVVASNASSLPEVVGEGGLLLSPDDVPSWGDALLSLIRSDSLRTEFRAKGIANAAHFSWPATALATARVYREVLARCAH